MCLKEEIESSSELISRQETKILDLENDKDKLRNDLNEAQRKIDEANKTIGKLSKESQNERESHLAYKEKSYKSQKEVEVIQTKNVELNKSLKFWKKREKEEIKVMDEWAQERKSIINRNLAKIGKNYTKIENK